MSLNQSDNSNEGLYANDKEEKKEQKKKVVKNRNKNNNPKNQGLNPYTNDNNQLNNKKNSVVIKQNIKIDFIEINNTNTFEGKKDI